MHLRRSQIASGEGDSVGRRFVALWRASLDDHLQSHRPENESNHLDMGPRKRTCENQKGHERKEKDMKGRYCLYFRVKREGRVWVNHVPCDACMSHVMSNFE